MLRASVATLFLIVLVAVVVSAARPRRSSMKGCPAPPRNCKKLQIVGSKRGCPLYKCAQRPTRPPRNCLKPRCPYEDTGKKDKQGCPVYRCKAIARTLEGKIDAILSDNKPKKEVALTRDDGGKTKQVEAGSKVSLKIAYNPSVGEGFGKLTGDVDIADNNGKFVADPHSPGETGYGGSKTYTFTVKKSTRVCVEEDYRGQPADQPFCVNLEVQGGFGGGGGDGGDKNAVTLTENDRGSTREMPAGTKVSLKIAYNPSVGESFGKLTGDVDIADKNGKFVADPHSPGETGYGGSKTYTFTVKKSTRVCLEESYRGSKVDQPFCVNLRTTL